MKSPSRVVSGTMAFLLAMACMLSGCQAKEKEPSQTDMLENYYEKIDVSYSQEVMDHLLTFGDNEQLGFRTAGSPAELAAGDYIAGEMEKIGLKNVRKEAVTVDTFTFSDASLRFQTASGEEYTATMAMFQTRCQAGETPVEVVYVGKGTAADYEGIDVTGKLVLFDIDQFNEYWINWPARQAQQKGALGVIAVNVDGYCTYSPETLGVQDFSGPADMPAFSMSVSDAQVLKEALEGKKELSVVLTAHSTVENDGTAYNIVGELPGKTDDVIYLFAHYDAYFRPVSDDTSGVGCMLGMAKALVDSGYQPEKTIRFVAHAAEEWGL